MSSFQNALLEAELEDAAEQPCLLCGHPRVASVGVWFPDPESSRRLGAPEGKTRACPYGLCRRCLKRPDVGTLVEDWFLGRAEREQAILAAGWEVDGNRAHPPGRPIPDWVHDALEHLEENQGLDPTGWVFAWFEEPRCVHVRTPEGEILTLAEPGTEPPAPPDYLLSDPAPPRRRRRPDLKTQKRRRRRRRSA